MSLGRKTCPPRSPNGERLTVSHADVDVVPWVATPAHVVGFMDGEEAVNTLPVWKTGHIASEPSVDRDNLPMFLIDATTRRGMSGSPVHLRVTGGYRSRDRRGEIVQLSESRTMWLGVYSGRTSENSELGRVWRPEVVRDTVMARLPAK